MTHADFPFHALSSALQAGTAGGAAVGPTAQVGRASSRQPWEHGKGGANGGDNEGVGIRDQTGDVGVWASRQAKGRGTLARSSALWLKWGALTAYAVGQVKGCGGIRLPLVSTSCWRIHQIVLPAPFVLQDKLENGRAGTPCWGHKHQRGGQVCLHAGKRVGSWGGGMTAKAL